MALNLSLVLLGSVSIGKSSLMVRLRGDTTRGIQNMRPTIFSDQAAVHYEEDDDDPDFPRVVLNIRDTAGQEKVHQSSVAPSLYRQAHIVWLAYAIDDAESFKAVESWYNRCRDFVDKSCVFVLVGNKCDLEAERVVAKSEADALSRKLGFSFFETSAKDMTNVQKTLQFSVREAVKRQRANATAQKPLPGPPPSFVLRQQAPGAGDDAAKKKDKPCCG